MPFNSLNTAALSARSGQMRQPCASAHRAANCSTDGFIGTIDSLLTRGRVREQFMSQLTEELVLNSLLTIIDPDLRKDIVTLGFVRDLKIDGGDVSFRIVLTTPACPVKEAMEGMARESVRVLPGVVNVNVTLDAEVPRARGL